MKKIFSILLILLCSVYAKEIKLSSLKSGLYFVRIGAFTDSKNLNQLRKIYRYQDYYLRHYRLKDGRAATIFYLVNISDEDKASRYVDTVLQNTPDSYMGLLYLEKNRLFLKKIIKKTPKKNRTVTVVKKQNVKKQNHSMFVSIASGYSFFDVKNNMLDSILEDGALDDDGVVYRLDIGYNFNPNIFATLFMDSSVLDSVRLLNLGSSFGYRYTLGNFKPYVSVLGGVSKLEWKKSPVQYTKNKQKEDNGLFYGAEVGCDYSITSGFNIFMSYEYLYLNHEALINDKYKITHKSQNSILLGARLEFLTN